MRAVSEPHQGIAPPAPKLRHASEPSLGAAEQLRRPQVVVVPPMGAHVTAPSGRVPSRVPARNAPPMGAVLISPFSGAGANFSNGVAPPPYYSIVHPGLGVGISTGPAISYPFGAPQGRVAHPHPHMAPAVCGGARPQASHSYAPRRHVPPQEPPRAQDLRSQVSRAAEPRAHVPRADEPRADRPRQHAPAAGEVPGGGRGAHLDLSSYESRELQVEIAQQLLELGGCPPLEPHPPSPYPYGNPGPS